MTRYQAHPVDPDEDYEMRPDSARRDMAVAAACALLLFMCYLVAEMLKATPA